MSIGKNSISRANKATSGVPKQSGAQKFYDAVDTEEPKLKAENISVDFIPTSLIIPTFDEDSITCSSSFQDVVSSVKNYGILIPLLLRKIKVNDEYCYRILSGHKRLFAAKLLKIESVPAEIIVCDDRKAAAIYSEIEKYDSKTKIYEKHNETNVIKSAVNSGDMPNYLL